MYVCLCNRVTDRELLRAAADRVSASGSGVGLSFGDEVADRLGVGVECGTCRDFAVEIIERAVASHALGRAARLDPAAYA